MVGGMEPGSAQQGLGKMAEQLLGWPSPDKVFAELQRLNNNMEMLAPDLRKLAAALDGDRVTDIRNLTSALNAVKVGDMLRILNEFNRLGGQVYERLWGSR